MTSRRPTAQEQDTLHYRRGWTDARFGHPPAQSTDSYLRGYQDALYRLRRYRRD